MAIKNKNVLILKGFDFIYQKFIYNFLIQLYIIIDKTYLGDDVMSKKRIIENHFRYSLNKNISNYKDLDKRFIQNLNVEEIQPFLFEMFNNLFYKKDYSKTHLNIFMKEIWYYKNHSANKNQLEEVKNVIEIFKNAYKPIKI